MATSINGITSFDAVLGGVLLWLRKRKGLQQLQVAKLVGLSASTWSRIEKGDSGLSIPQLKAVSKELDCRPGDVLDMAEVVEKALEAAGVVVTSSDNLASRYAEIYRSLTPGSEESATGPHVLESLPIKGSLLESMVANILSRWEPKEPRRDA